MAFSITTTKVEYIEDPVVKCDKIFVVNKEDLSSAEEGPSTYEESFYVEFKTLPRVKLFPAVEERFPDVRDSR